jgi:hypothetical protein
MCFVLLDGAEVQGCAGETVGHECAGDADCADASAYCGNPAHTCRCVVQVRDAGGWSDYGSGYCRVIAVPHPTMHCGWLSSCGGPGDYCEDDSGCCSSLWDPTNTACVSGVCAYPPPV